MNSKFLECTEVIDWQNPAVFELARQLARNLSGHAAIAKQCFEWVRDEIKHSIDYKLQELPCSASEVLAAGSGYCFAKSHLLAALLRANGIPAGFCYQRLRLNGEGTAFTLHGLNAVLLPDIGWYKIDARGNRKDINAQFAPPDEHLAFRPELPGEKNFPEILTEPLSVVVSALKRCRTAGELLHKLPDLQQIPQL